jgi:hypothetical protein
MAPLRRFSGQLQKVSAKLALSRRTLTRRGLLPWSEPLHTSPSKRAFCTCPQA